VVALVAFTTSVSISNRRLEAANQGLIAANHPIRQKSDELTAQYQKLEDSNRKLVEARAEAEAQRDQATAVIDFLVSSFRKPDPTEAGHVPRPRSGGTQSTPPRTQSIGRGH